jgi:Fur family ferric uptake transcriptional regulator
MQDAADRLRERGLNVTAQRLAVLRAVECCPHAPAERVAEFVRAELGTVSRQAVYDALASLTDGGLIRRLQPAGAPALFDPRVGDGHHHAICRQCGAVADIEPSVGAAPVLSPTTDCGYAIEASEVLYWGLCPSCRPRRVPRSARNQQSRTTKPSTPRSAR